METAAGLFYVISGAAESTARVTTSEGAEVPSAACQDHKNVVHHVSASPDNTRVATASSDCTSMVFEIGRRPFLCLRSHMQPVTRAEWSQSGKLIATCSLDKKAKVWDTSSGKLLQTFAAHTEATTGAVFLSETSVATASLDGSVIVWTIATGAPSRTIAVGEPCRCLAVQPVMTTLQSHASLASAQSSSGIVAAAGAVLQTIASSLTAPASLLAVGCSSGALKVVDYVMGTTIAYKSHSGEIKAVCFNQRGSQLLSGAEDGLAKLWDFALGRVLTEYAGHSKAINSVCFSPTEEAVITASDDSTIRIWNARASDCLRILRPHGTVAIFCITTLPFTPLPTSSPAPGIDHTHSVLSELLREQAKQFLLSIPLSLEEGENLHRPTAKRSSVGTTAVFGSPAAMAASPSLAFRSPTTAVCYGFVTTLPSSNRCRHCGRKRQEHRRPRPPPLFLNGRTISTHHGKVASARRVHVAVRHLAQPPSQTQGPRTGPTFSVLFTFSIIGSEPKGRQRAQNTASSSAGLHGLHSGVSLGNELNVLPELYDASILNDNHTDMPTERRGRLVINLPSYRSSILKYMRPLELKEELNRAFQDKYPFLAPEMTLSKITKMKRVLIDLSKQLDIDFSVSALAILYLEKLVLRNLLTKQTRKLFAAACYTLAVKFYDFHALSRELMQPITRALERYIAPSTQRDLAQAEFAVFRVLHFSLHVPLIEIETHIIAVNRTVELTPNEYYGTDFDLYTKLLQVEREAPVIEGSVGEPDEQINDTLAAYDAGHDGGQEPSDRSRSVSPIPLLERH